MPLLIGAAVVVLGLAIWLLSGPAVATPATTATGDAAATQATVADDRAAAPGSQSPPPSTPTDATIAPLPSAPSTAVGAGTRPGQVATERILFAGSTGTTTFRAAHALSDGTFLIAGGSDDLGWTGAAPRIVLPADGLPRPGGERIAFVLHLSADLAAIKAVWHFPKGASGDLRRIRSTEVPGAPTGDLYISGDQATFGPTYKDDGYWIARLDGNGVQREPSRPVWVHAVQAGGRKAGEYAAYKGDGAYKKMQPWDVGGDGRVVYASGAPHDNAWATLEFIDASARPLRLPALPYQSEQAWGFALKAGNNGSLRSATQADFDLRQDDENGNPGRKGRWPDDYYFQGPLPERKAPGYTGYRVSDKPTQRVGKIAIDRRNNHLYFGTSTQSRLPNGNPDFEPAIIALDDQGRLKWWARGYREIERVGENAKAHQDKLNSPPDQYIDGVAIDYANDRLVVLGRCHGNGVINFWRSQDIKDREGREGFQRQYTGTMGNAHYSWLGRYNLADGRIRAATYVADLGDYLKPNKRFPEGHPLAGWPMPNDGWHNLQTTRIHDLETDAAGRTHLVGMGKRSYTTVDARIPNLIPTGGGDPAAAWCPFVRVYDTDLGGIAYSSLVRGPWPGGTDPGHDIDLSGVLPLADGVLCVGTHTSKGSGSNLPTTAVPAWGAATAPGPVSGVLAILRVKKP